MSKNDTGNEIVASGCLGLGGLIAFIMSCAPLIFVVLVILLLVKSCN